MPTARLTHGFVFVQDLERVVSFYEGALGMTARRTSDEGYVMMEATEGASVALHRVPEAYRSPLSVPPAWRDDTAYKLCIATDDLPGLRAAILAHGGQAKDPWSWESTTFCETTDPEGNVIQIYSPAGG